MLDTDTASIIFYSKLFRDCNSATICVMELLSQLKLILAIWNNKKGAIDLKITDAIKSAQTEHVIYFLLAAYVETLGFYDPLRSAVPSYVHRLPIAGRTDVTERLSALRETHDANAQHGSGVQGVLREAVDVFDTASQQLRSLENSITSFGDRPIEPLA